MGKPDSFVLPVMILASLLACAVAEMPKRVTYQTDIHYDQDLLSKLGSEQSVDDWISQVINYAETLLGKLGPEILIIWENKGLSTEKELNDRKSSSNWGLFKGTHYFGYAAGHPCKEMGKFVVGYLAENDLKPGPQGYIPIKASGAVFAHEVGHLFSIPEDNEFGRAECVQVGTNIMSAGSNPGKYTPHSGSSNLIYSNLIQGWKQNGLTAANRSSRNGSRRMDICA